MSDPDEVLRAVAAGRVTRSDTGYGAPHLLDGQNVTFDVRLLARNELVDHHMSGPPTITPLGEQLLAEAGGQRFTLAEIPARYRRNRRTNRRRWSHP